MTLLFVSYIPFLVILASWSSYMKTLKNPCNSIILGNFLLNPEKKDSSTFFSLLTFSYNLNLLNYIFIFA